METNEKLITEFIDESNELLHSVEEDVLSIENQANPDNEVVNKIFRAVHTIKGSSGLLQLSEINRLSHQIETIFDKVRKNKLVLDSESTDKILTAIDILKQLINSPENIDNNRLASILPELSKITDSQQETEKTAQKESNTDKETYQELKIIFCKEASSTASIFIEKIFILAKSFQDNIAVEMLRKLQTIETVAKLLGYHNIVKVAYVMREFMLVIRQNSKVEEKDIGTFVDINDLLQSILDDIEYSASFDISRLDEICKIYGIALLKIPERADTIARLEKFQKSDSTSDKNTGKPLKLAKHETLRIDTSIITNMMNYAGELVLIRNQQMKYIESNEKFTELIHGLDTITMRIHETVMQTRLQPISNVFGKFPRIVRDLAKQLNKNVELVLIGEDVEIDKSYTDALTSPLTHLIRNAISHGIEKVENRLKARKNPLGIITLKAYYDAGMVNVSISDDGCGINTELIKRKALERKLKTREELDLMHESEIHEIIFLPGFTTSESLNDVSGRGVGMDAVKSTIEQLGGMIEIHSQKGEGTTFLLKLPFTLAIVSALIVGDSNEKFVVPQINIAELRKVYADETDKNIVVSGDNIFLYVRNKLIPVIWLSDILEHEKPYTAATKKKILKKLESRKKQFLEIIILKSGIRRFGLIAAEIVATEEIVVKPVPDFFEKIRIYSGTTILGDGSTVLILDVEGIKNHADISYNHSSYSSAKEQQTISDEEEVLLLKFGEKEIFGVNISGVKHIYPIQKSQIERVGNNYFVNINNQSYKILYLDNFLEVSPLQPQSELFIIEFKYNLNKYCLLFSEIIDIEYAVIELNTKVLASEYILGSSIINNRLTLFFDYYNMLATEEQDNNLILQSAPKFTGKQLVLFESSVIHARMMELLLQRKGFKVAVSNTLQSFYKMVASYRPRLVLMDVNDYYLTTNEHLKRIKNAIINNEFPALALCPDEEIMQLASNTGFSRCVLKSDPEQLLYELSDVLTNVKTQKDE